MKKTGALLEEVRSVIRKLRAPEGCPWDREQTPAKVKNYLVEELYELLEAVDRDDAAHLTEETGDLLFLLLFLVAMYEEQERFSLDAALAAARDKMVRRHPHIFGTTRADSTEEVRRNWQKIKEQEGRPKRASLLEGLPPGLPALARSALLTERAARVGFDWAAAADVLVKIREETAELEQAIAGDTPARVQNEIGDLLLSVVNLSRHLGIDPEQALRTTNQRFCDRFAFVEQELRARGRTPAEATLEEMDALWDEAKERESMVPQ